MIRFKIKKLSDQELAAALVAASGKQKRALWAEYERRVADRLASKQVQA